MNETSQAASSPFAPDFRVQVATEPNDDLHSDDPDDEAEPLEDDVYPGNDEYEDVPEEDEA